MNLLSLKDILKNYFIVKFLKRGTLIFESKILKIGLPELSL
jgi:hypothetical protein